MTKRGAQKAMSVLPVKGPLNEWLHFLDARHAYPRLAHRVRAPGDHTNFPLDKRLVVCQQNLTQEAGAADKNQHRLEAGSKKGHPKRVVITAENWTNLGYVSPSEPHILQSYQQQSYDFFLPIVKDLVSRLNSTMLFHGGANWGVTREVKPPNQDFFYYRFSPIFFLSFFALSISLWWHVVHH